MQRLRSRAPELYGFVAWTSTTFLYFLYLIWALVPDKYILATGIDWYPNREWAVLIPAWSIVLVLLTYFNYMALAIFRTPSFNELSTAFDSRSAYPHLEPNSPAFAALSQEGALPELYDIPLGIVNQVLYED